MVHSYLNYGNIAWGSTTQTKLKKLASKQRQTTRVTYAAEYAREKMGEIKVLNISKLTFTKTLTGFSQSDFVEGNILSNQTKSAVSSRGPRLRNRLLNQEQKTLFLYLRRFLI